MAKNCNPGRASSGETRQPPVRLRVSAAAETALRSGHPWLFSDSVREQNRPGTTGELAVIYDRKDRFLAVGLFDPQSSIRVRIVHTGKPVPIDTKWWRQHFQSALDRRAGLFGPNTTGYRWIHGENDGWPGLVLDRYDQVLVLKLYTAAWLPLLPELTGIIQELLRPSHLVLRLSRNIQASAHSEFRRNDGDLILGPRFDGRPVFLENRLRIEADAIRGQKTGFFLDQRENRRRVEALAQGRTVLNAFSYSGVFSLYAARGGAKSVTDIDISMHALAAGQRNFELNQDQPALAACGRDAIKADAFDWLRDQAGNRFDLVVLDPPSLAKSEAERRGAIQAYGNLAGDGIRALRAGGILVAASCSAHVTAREFFDVVMTAGLNSGRKFIELERTGQPSDHPASIPEAHYLKCIYLKHDKR